MGQPGVVTLSRHDILVVATYGKIYAIHKKNGDRLWRTDAPNSGVMNEFFYATALSLFVTDYDTVLVGGAGKTAALDLFSGATLWVNDMRASVGCGTHEVSVVSTPSQMLFERVDELQSGYTTMNMRPITVACTHGKCMGIDKKGHQLWRFDCPGGGSCLPSVIIDPPNGVQQRPQIVYVGSGQMVYCLIAETGDVVWKTKVSNALVGTGYITMATTWNSRVAAETFTGFNQCPIGQFAAIERIRRQSRQ